MRNLTQLSIAILILLCCSCATLHKENRPEPIDRSGVPYREASKADNEVARKKLESAFTALTKDSILSAFSDYLTCGALLWMDIQQSNPEITSKANVY